MINLNTQLCDELDLTYWQLNTASVEKKPQNQISHEEKDLLTKILLAKSIQLKDSMLRILDHGVVVIQLENHSLAFDDTPNEGNSVQTIHLPKLSAMLKDNKQKKVAWFILKNLTLS